MKDINGVELSLGDKVLVAFASTGNCHMEYAIIIQLLDGYKCRVKFTSNKNSGSKTRTLNAWGAKILKLTDDRP
jgi:hypothetical protein